MIESGLLEDTNKPKSIIPVNLLQVLKRTVVGVQEAAGSPSPTLIAPGTTFGGRSVLNGVPADREELLGYGLSEEIIQYKRRWFVVKDDVRAPGATVDDARPRGSCQTRLHLCRLDLSAVFARRIRATICPLRSALPLNDEPAVAIEDTGQEVERAGQIDIGNINMPVVVGRQRLHEPDPLIRSLRPAAVRATSLHEHAAA